MALPDNEFWLLRKRRQCCQAQQSGYQRRGGFEFVNRCERIFVHEWPLNTVRINIRHRASFLDSESIRLDEFFTALAVV